MPSLGPTRRAIATPVRTVIAIITPYQRITSGPHSSTTGCTAGSIPSWSEGCRQTQGAGLGTRDWTVRLSWWLTSLVPSPYSRSFVYEACHRIENQRVEDPPNRV